MDENDFSGQMIGHYRLLRVIGKGAFGRVFQAQNTELEDHVVAIKVLRPNHDSPQERERFQQEARLLLKLQHRYILRFRDLLPDEDHLCLVTEFASNGSLRDRIRPLRHQPQKLLPMQEVRTILSQVGQALQYIHEQNMIHCDLKPENILFNNQEEALLADFGIAKIVAKVNREGNKIAGRGTGTPAYMAPEQIGGQPTAQSDQYAFACVTYELLTGRTPFTGTTHLDLWQQHRTKQPTDPRAFNSQIPEFMAKAILKALAKTQPTVILISMPSSPPRVCLMLRILLCPKKI